MPKLRDIPQFTKIPCYAVDTPWDFLERQLEHYHEWGLELCPDFQRGHVWTRKQQIAFVEFSLRGGKSARNIYFNCPGWMHYDRNEMVLVDGLQRLTAARRFLANEIKAFGYYYKEYEDEMGMLEPSFRIHVNDLPTRADVLRWYLEMNYGGTPHRKREIDRVQKLLDEELSKGSVTE